MFLWRPRMQFWPPGRSLPMKSRQFISQCPKIKSNFLPEIFLWTRTMQFWKLSRKTFDKRSQIYRWMSGKSGKLSFKTFFLDLFLWTRNRLFWQTRWNFSDKRHKIFCSISEFLEKKFFPKKLFFFEKTLWTRKMRFWQFSRKTSTKRHKVTAECQKRMKKIQNYVFRQNSPLDM